MIPATGSFFLTSSQLYPCWAVINKLLQEAGYSHRTKVCDISENETFRPAAQFVFQD